MSNCHEELDRLAYLEKLIDFEGGVNRGPLTGKDFLVYAPSKTGTVSLFQSLCRHIAEPGDQNRPERRVLHNHSNAQLVGNLKFSPGAPAEAELLDRPILRDLLRWKALHEKPVTIISSFRDPLSRGISDCFEPMQTEVDAGRRRLEDISYEECFEWLRSWLDRALVYQFHPLEEIEPGLFSQAQFNQRTKSCLVNRGDCRILTLSLHHVERWQTALEHALGFEGIHLVRANSAEDKAIASAYRAFKARLRLPVQLIERLYFDSAQTKYLCWFCTSAEVEDFYQAAIMNYGERSKPGVRATWNALFRLGIGRPLSPPSAEDQRAKSFAEIQGLTCEAEPSEPPGRVRVRVRAIIINRGTTIWPRGNGKRGPVACALRSKGEGTANLTTTWQPLPWSIYPGEQVTLSYNTTLPVGDAMRSWQLDLVCLQRYWFGDHGLLTGARTLDSSTLAAAARCLEDVAPDPLTGGC